MSPISAFTARRARHLLLGAAILSATVLTCFPVAPHAQAGTGACTSEPVATFSDGTTEDMNATVQDSASDVSQVAWTIKVPNGVNLVTWTDTAQLGPNDTHNVINTSSGYGVGVKVSAGQKASVSASADLLHVSATWGQVGSTSGSGNTNQQLWMPLSG